MFNPIDNTSYTNGYGKSGIQIELFFDYLCSASQAENIDINELMTEDWLDGTVADQIFVKYIPYPVSYNVHSYEVARLVPYFINMCTRDSSKCFSNEYRNYCYEHLEMVKENDNISKAEFITWWSKQVGENFGISSIDIEASYDN